MTQDVDSCITGDLRDIQADPHHMAYTEELVHSFAELTPTAGNLIKYLGEFITLKCAPDMLALKLFPNAKEISESFAAYEAVRRHLQDIPLDDPDVHMFAVGDGGTPRTAATFAFRSRWTCHSIDPNLKDSSKWMRINRLHCYPVKVEEFTPVRCKTAVIAAVHSHARLDQAILCAKADRVVVISMPCCVKQKLSIPPDKVYTDKSIISPKREMLIWRDISGIPEFTQPSLFN